MFNCAVYAANEAKANARAAVVIKLDAAGNAVNTGHNGRPFTVSEIIAAQEAQSYQAYAGAMAFLDGIIGDDADTKTRKAFDQAKAKFQSVGHAEEMRDKLITAALNGSNAALIAYAAACTYLNPYATVDFSWFVSGQTFATTDLEGYQAAPKTVSVTVSIAFPQADQIDDYEGFAVSYRPTPTVPVTPTPTTPPKPAPALPVAAPIIPAPAPVITDGNGRVLTQTATGWQAESASSPGDTHTVTPDGKRCNCPGFTGRYRKCWHTATVRAYVAQQESAQQRRDRANALPISPPIKTRSGIKSRMWK